MSGAETSVDGATAAVTAAAAAPLDTSAPPALALAPFAAASAKEAELYYHCDEWFLRADTRAAVQKIFRNQVSAQLSEGAVDLLLCFLQRLTRWVLIRTRTFSLDQPDSVDRDSDWGSHNEFGGEEEGAELVFDGRRAHVQWCLKRLFPIGIFDQLMLCVRKIMDKFKDSDMESQANLSSETMWPTLPGSAAQNDRPGGYYPRGDRLPAESQLFLGCALDFVTGIAVDRTEMAYKSVNVHGHTHGRHYATDQHPHALDFLAKSANEDGYFRCDICQSDGAVNVYRCPSDACDFDIHARCFIPRTKGGQSGESDSSDNGGATGVDGEPERKRQRVDETGASVGTAVASASPSSSSSSAAVAGSSSVAAALPVWTVADLTAALTDEWLRMLCGPVGVLRDLCAAREWKLDVDPSHWVGSAEEPCAWLWPHQLEAPFEDTTTEKPLLSSTLANIRDLLQRYAWFHDPAQIAEVKRRFLSGTLVGGHPLWQRRRRIRPVAFYGRSWKPRWTMPDKCIAAKVAFRDLPQEEQQAAEEEEGEDEEGDPFGKTSFIGDYPFDTIAFDLIDGAGREWPLLLEYRECT